MPAINWLAVLVAALSAFVLGGLWYGPLLGKAWFAASGMTEERAKQGSPGRIFGIAFVLEFIAAAVLAMFIGAEATAGFGAAAGAAAGAFWVATAFGVVYLFEHRTLAHWAVNAGYQIVAYTLMGIIIGAWPWSERWAGARNFGNGLNGGLTAGPGPGGGRVGGTAG